MVVFISSLAQIAPTLDSQSVDAVVVSMERLSHAPVALQLLNYHVDYSDWTVLNIRQVTEAAAVDSGMAAAEDALMRLRLAEEDMNGAPHGVESVARNMEGHAIRAVRRLATASVQIAQDADSKGVGSDTLLVEINQQLAAVQKARGRAICHEADPLLLQMQQALQFLDGAERRLATALVGITEVIAALQQLRGDPREEALHTLTRPSPQMLRLLRSVAASTSRIQSAYTSAPGPVNRQHLLLLVTAALDDVREARDSPLPFNFRRYTGPLDISSLRDVEAQLASRPHSNETGCAPMKLLVVLVGVSRICESTVMFTKVQEAVNERGWRAIGLNTLARAKRLDDSLVLLAQRLGHLLQSDVLDPNDEVLKPECFQLCAECANDLEGLLGADQYFMSPDVRQVAQEAAVIAASVNAPPSYDNSRRGQIFRAVVIVERVRQSYLPFSRRAY